MWTGADAKEILQTSRQLALHSTFEHSFNLQTGDRLLHVSGPTTAAEGLRCPFGIELEPGVFSELLSETRVRARREQRWEWDCTNSVLHTPLGRRVRIDRFATDDSELARSKESTSSISEQALAKLPSEDVLFLQSGFAGIGNGGELLRRFRASVEGWSIGEWQKVLWLLGRGPGLTPSGDDFVVGMLGSFAVCGLPGASSESAIRLRRHVAELGATVTTQVSVEYLISACKGHFARPLERVFSSLITDADSCNEAVSKLRSVGHTSGTDTLLGVKTAMSVISNNEATSFRKYGHEQR